MSPEFLIVVIVPDSATDSIIGFLRFYVSCYNFPAQKRNHPDALLGIASCPNVFIFILNKTLSNGMEQHSDWDFMLGSALVCRKDRLLCCCSTLLKRTLKTAFNCFSFSNDATESLQTCLLLHSRHALFHNSSTNSKSRYYPFFTFLHSPRSVAEDVNGTPKLQCLKSFVVLLTLSCTGGFGEWTPQVPLLTVEHENAFTRTAAAAAAVGTREQKHRKEWSECSLLRWVVPPQRQCWSSGKEER